MAQSMAQSEISLNGRKYTTTSLDTDSQGIQNKDVASTQGHQPTKLRTTASHEIQRSNTEDSQTSHSKSKSCFCGWHISLPSCNAIKYFFHSILESIRTCLGISSRTTTETEVQPIVNNSSLLCDHQKLKEALMAAYQQQDNSNNTQSSQLSTLAETRLQGLIHSFEQAIIQLSVTANTIRKHGLHGHLLCVNKAIKDRDAEKTNALRSALAALVCLQRLPKSPHAHCHILHDIADIILSHKPIAGIDANFQSFSYAGEGSGYHELSKSQQQPDSKESMIMANYCDQASQWMSTLKEIYFSNQETNNTANNLLGDLFERITIEQLGG